MKINYLLPLLVAGLTLTRISATTVVPPTFQQLVQQAELIFQGTVTDSRSVWEGEGGQRHIETYVTFNVDDSVKGKPGSPYTIRLLGGTVGDETLEVTDAPKFQIGDREILFVEHNNDQFVPLVGISYGRFHLQNDEQTGRDMVVNNQGQAVRDLSQLGENQEAAAASDMAEAISADDLKAAIHTQLGDPAGHPAK